MNKERILVVDAGNTALKCAVFQDAQIIYFTRLDKNDFGALNRIYAENFCSGVAISSVRDEETTNNIVEGLEDSNVFLLNYPYLLPFGMQYNTPELLGKDRLCNAAAAYYMTSTDYALSIDIGTCVKFDLIGKEDGYMGGSISPGIQLRYNALNDYTDNLPRLHEKSKNKLTGTTTEESIRSGVMIGIEAEINNMIEQYASKYGPLTIFVTGGDSAHFDLVAKNGIFAHENLTLIGLYHLYTFAQLH